MKQKEIKIRSPPPHINYNFSCWENSLEQSNNLILLRIFFYLFVKRELNYLNLLELIFYQKNKNK